LVVVNFQQSERRTHKVLASFAPSTTTISLADTTNTFHSNDSNNDDDNINERSTQQPDLKEQQEPQKKDKNDKQQKDREPTITKGKKNKVCTNRLRKFKAMAATTVTATRRAAAKNASPTKQHLVRSTQIYWSRQQKIICALAASLGRPSGC